MKKRNLQILSQMAITCNDETRKPSYKSVLVEKQDNKLYAVITDGYILLRKHIDDKELMQFLDDNKLMDNQDKNENSILLSFEKHIPCKKRDYDYNISLQYENKMLLNNEGIVHVSKHQYVYYKSICVSNKDDMIENFKTYSLDTLTRLLVLIEKITEKGIREMLKFEQSKKNIGITKIRYSKDVEEYALIMPCRNKEF